MVDDGVFVLVPGAVELGAAVSQYFFDLAFGGIFEYVVSDEVYGCVGGLFGVYFSPSVA